MFHTPTPTALIIIAIVFLVLFGANRLPEAARSLGRASQEFKKGIREGGEPESDRPALKE